MKKLSHFLVALVICLTTIISLSACGKDKVVSAKVTGGLPVRLELNDELKTDDVVVKATYKSGDTATFTSDELEFSEFKTDTAGVYDLEITIKSEDYSFKYAIEVVADEADVNAITKLESKLVKAFRENSSLAPTQDGSPEEEYFIDRDEPLYVGHNNSFHFDLSIAGIDGYGELVPNISSARTNVKVERWNGSAYVELTGTDLDAVVSINDINAVLDFEPAAANAENDQNKFRITVTAANPDTDYEEAQYSFTQEITVIDGFNVYDVDDLSVFDNYNLGWTDAHNRVKAKYGLETLDDIKAVILQRDIELLAPYSEKVNEENGEIVKRTPIDINENNAHLYVRADAFWNGTEGTEYNNVVKNTDQVVIGTPYNSSRAGIFRRQMEDGDKTFSMIGNYFTINAIKFPRMVVYGTDPNDEGVILDYTKDEDTGVWKPGDGAKYINSFTTLFYTENKEADYDVPAADKVSGQHITDAETQVVYKNLAFSGNGAMSQDPRNSGALSFMKNREVSFHAYNTLTYNFHTPFTFELGKNTVDGDGTYVVEKCRAYNAYQTFFMLWGAENTTIIECDFRNAGGPGILADSVHLGERGQTDFDKAYYLDGVWYNGKDGVEENDLVGTYNKEYVAGPIVNIVDTDIICKATGEENWYSNNNAAQLISTLTMFEMFFNGNMTPPQGWTTLGYQLGYQKDDQKTDKENDAIAEQYAKAYFNALYPPTDNSYIAGTAPSKHNPEQKVPVMDFKAVLGRFQPVIDDKDGIMTENQVQLKGEILTFDSREKYYQYYDLENPEKTTNALDLSRMGYLASMTYYMGLPIFESQSSGAYAATPLADTGVVAQGLQTSFTMAKIVLDTTYSTMQPILVSKGMSVPSISDFSNSDLDTKKATLFTILDKILGMGDAAIEYYDRIYNGIAAGVEELPFLNMLEICPIANWSNLTTAAEKYDALIAGFTTLVNRGNDSPMDGEYVNLYLPDIGGYMGLVIGLYPRG